IFPQGPLPFGAGLLTYQYQQDPAYWLAGCRAQNRWLADFCAEVPGRRAGVGLVTVDDIDTTVQEITWLREHGVFGGIMLSSGTPACPLSSPSSGPTGCAPRWPTSTPSTSAPCSGTCARPCRSSPASTSAATATWAPRS